MKYLIYESFHEYFCYDSNSLTKIEGYTSI